MNVTVTRYSTVYIVGSPDVDEARAVCERYLYDATRIIDGVYAPVFVLATSATFDCADTEGAAAFEKAARTALELRRYQLARFESGLHVTGVFATRSGAEKAAIDAL